jgi:hypothetical protein
MLNCLDKVAPTIEKKASRLLEIASSCALLAERSTMFAAPSGRRRTSPLHGPGCGFAGALGVMDLEVIDQALTKSSRWSKYQSERLQGVEEDERVSQMPRADAARRP